jgi:hypothetical protein
VLCLRCVDGMWGIADKIKVCLQASSALITAGFRIRRAAEHGPPLQIEASNMCMCHMAGTLPEHVMTGAVALCQAGAVHVSQLQYQAVAKSLTAV